MPRSKAAQAAIDSAQAQVIVDEMAEVLKKGMALSTNLNELGEYKRGEGYDSKMTASPEAEEMVTVYNAMTGEPSVIYLYMLKNYLGRRFPKENWIPTEHWNKAVYTLTPAVDYDPGKYLCIFSTKHPDYDKLGEYGLAHVQCERKGPFHTALAAEQHGRKKHRDEWLVIERAKTMVKEDEMRAMQLKQLEAFTRMADKS